MGFLAPWFLAGFAAIGLPVYFHLLRQHKSTPRPFSSLMFFEQSTQSSVKHRRLRYLTLLAFRAALLALLVLAFASPFVMHTIAGFGSGGTQLVLVVDNSFSMREGDRLERAKQQAVGEAAGIGEGNSGQVATLGSRLEFLTLPTDDRGEAVAAIESIEPSDTRSSYGELARALRAMSETAREPLEVHLYTDIQRSAMPPGFVDLALPSNVGLEIHAVANDLVPNFAVENVIAPASLFDPSKVTVQATIAGYGTQEANHTVSLLADGKPLESKDVTVPAGGRATVEFHSLDIAYGFSRCEVRIGSADTLPADDSFLFAVERADPRQLLFIRRGSRSRDLLYFQAALDSVPNSAFRLQAIDGRQAGDIDPSRFAAVVISDPGSLPQALENSLRQYLQSGGSVLIATGAGTGRLDSVPVLNVPILDSGYASRRGERFWTVGFVDQSHPVVGIQNLWEGVKFFQAVRVDPAESTVLARLADETPLLIEVPVGEGRGLLFTSTFDNLSNDLPLYPSFVAFIERAMAYLGRLEDRTAAHPVDSFVELRVGTGQSSAVELIDPSGERALSLEDATSANSYQVRSTGFYELRRSADRNEMIAVNADRRESNLTVIPDETVSLWQGSDGVEQAVAGEETERRPWKLWWYVLLIGFLIAVGESIISARYLRIDRGAA
jgi:aerotolerance regulator-like protein/VWA domain-containing protein